MKGPIVGRRDKSGEHNSVPDYPARLTHSGLMCMEEGVEEGWWWHNAHFIRGNVSSNRVFSQSTWQYPALAAA